MNRTNDDGYVAVFTVPAQSGNVYFLIFRVRIVFFKGVFFFFVKSEFDIRTEQRGNRQNANICIQCGATIMASGGKLQ